MSRTLIFAVLGIASAGLVSGFDDESCKKLNLIKNYTHGLQSHAFVENMENCKDVPDDNPALNLGSRVLLDVYKAIVRDNHKKEQQCTFTSEMEHKLIECVISVTGIVRDQFNNETAKQHFGLNSTEAIVFDSNKCEVSGKLLDCIEDKFSAEKLTRELKGCKDNIYRGFNVTSDYCEIALIRADRNSGLTYLPSDTLILASLVMLVKLAVFSRF